MKKKSPEKASEGGDLPLFFAPGFLETLTLPEEESRHASRVLRLTEGESILVTDGAGALYRAELTDVSPKAAVFALGEEILSSPRTTPHLHLAVAPTKSMDRIEWLLEKMVEVGLSKFTLLSTERTVRRHLNLDRLEKVMISALKQSRKRFVTEIGECRSVEELFSEIDRTVARGAYIGYCSDEFPKTPITSAFQKGMPSLFLIGPEGDFTPEEVRTAVSFGAVPVTLGEERLRTETAGLYAGVLHAVLNS